MKIKTDKTSNLSTYVIIMLLSIIIIIIIAAMADIREQNFQTQLESTTQANMAIQNEIVALKDENYKLSQEKANLEKQIAEVTPKLEAYSAFSKVMELLINGNFKEAKQKLAEIDQDTLTDELKPFYYMVQTYIR